MRSRNSREYRSLLAGERLVVEASEAVHEAMERAGVNKKQLAARLDVRPSEISQRLSGRRNLTLRSFAAMMEALGVRAKLTIEDSERPYAPGAKWVTPQSNTPQTMINAANAIVIINAIKGAEPTRSWGTSQLNEYGGQLVTGTRALNTAGGNYDPFLNNVPNSALTMGEVTAELVTEADLK